MGSFLSTVFFYKSFVTKRLQYSEELCKEKPDSFDLRQPSFTLTTTRCYEINNQFYATFQKSYLPNNNKIKYYKYFIKEKHENLLCDYNFFFLNKRIK